MTVCPQGHTLVRDRERSRILAHKCTENKTMFSSPSTALLPAEACSVVGGDWRGWGRGEGVPAPNRLSPCWNQGSEQSAQAIMSPACVTVSLKAVSGPQRKSPKLPPGGMPSLPALREAPVGE